MTRLRAAALLFGVLLLPCVAACTTIGFGFHAKAREIAGDVPAPALADAKAVKPDAFVAVTTSFRKLAEDRLPIDDSYDVRAERAAVFDVDGAPNVVAYCEGATCLPLHHAGSRELVRVEGRLCHDVMTFFGCRLPPPVQAWVKAEAKRRAIAPSRLRVLWLGESPGAVRAEGYFGLGLAAALLVLYAAVVLLVATRRRKTPPIALEDAFTIMAPPEEVRRLVEQAVAGRDAYRVEERDAARLVFAQGRTETDGQMLGILSPDVVPRRTTVTWSAQPYHPTTVRVRIEDRVTWLTEVKALEPLLRAALERTREQIASALQG